MKTLIVDDDIANSHIADILKEIYIDRMYAPLLEGRKDMVIVDLGANVGITAQYFSPYAKIVVAIEPCRRHFDCMAKMLAANDIVNVRNYCAAVAAETGTGVLHHSSNITAHSLSPLLGVTGTSEDVITYDMIDILKITGEPRIDLLKMVIEGAEYEVIASAAFDEVAPRIDRIVGELHGWDTSGVGKTSEEINDMAQGLVDRLSSFGFTVGFRQAAAQPAMFCASRID